MCQTFKATIWYGLSTIWTRYVAALLFLTLRLRQPRLSMASIPPAPLPVSAYLSSDAYAAIGGYSQHHTRLHLTFSMLVPSRSQGEGIVLCTWEPLMVRGFASNVCGFILMIQRVLPKCVADAVVSLALSIMRFLDLLPRGCNVEAPDAPKHFTPAGCHDRRPPTHFGLDVRRSSAGLHRGEL